MSALLGQGQSAGEVVRVRAADVISPPDSTPPLQSFEELGIPDKFRTAVQAELTQDERLLWLGRPSRNPEVHPRPPALRYAGFGLIGLGLVVAVASGGHAFAIVFGGVLALIGGACLLPWLINPGSGCRFCYVVTSRRAILFEPSLWGRGPRAQSWGPHQLLGMERRPHASVPGAGDLVFEYTFALPGNQFDLKNGSFFQQGAGPGLNNQPQRVARGFLLLDQVAAVERLIRTTLLGELQGALDEPKSAPAPGAAADAEPAVSAACACGVTVEAPAVLAGRSVKCPKCAAPVAITGRGPAADPGTYREDGPVAADLKDRAVAELEPGEKLVWLGRPLDQLVFRRGIGYLAGGAAGALIALVWLVGTLLPAKPAAAVKGNAPAPAAKASGASLLLPAGLLLVSGCCAAVPFYRRHLAQRTCYALTTRRALVHKQGLFGPTRESYSPLEVSGVRRYDTRLAAGAGDLVFRTVYVLSSTRSRGGVSQQSVKAVHYGFLAVAQVGEVEKLLRETLIDRFADRLSRANNL